MIIKRATITDAEEILSLQKLAYQSEAEIYNDFNISPLTQTLEEIKIERFFSRPKRFELFTGHKSKRNIYLYQKRGYMIFLTEKNTDNLELVYLEKILATASNSG